MSDFDAMHGQEGPASEEGTGRSFGRDAAGLGLFALATLLGVSVFMSISSPAEEPRGTTALFTALCGLLGAWPLFALAIALAFLGGRLWVAGVAQGLGRHLLGALAATLALSVLASAISAGAGGSFGDLVGSNASRILTPFAGVPLALALLAGVVWAVWIRSSGTLGAYPNVEKTAPRRVAPTDTGGLTPDEAAALLPPRGTATARESQDGDAATPKELAIVTGRSIPVAPDLKPLYPPDVRLQGGIPEGTRPLETRDQAQPLRARQAGRTAEPERPAAERSRAPAEPLGRPAAPAALSRPPEPHAAPPERPAVADLAAADSGWCAAGELLTPAAPAIPLRDPRGAQNVQPLPTASAPLPPSWESAEDAELEEGADEELELTAAPELAADTDDDTESAVETEDGALPQPPGWEQPGLFDEEPVDAYGTPTKLVDALRKSNRAAAGRLEKAPEEVQELEDELDGELDEDELAEVEEAELDESDEDEVDEAESDEDDEEGGEANAEDASSDEDDSSEESDGEVADEDDADTEQEPAAEAEEEPEPEVILEPRKRQRPTRSEPRKRAAPKAAAVQVTEALDPESDLLLRAGTLFIQRGRVAVSMLQRDFSLDFKQATSLLDQLQEAGLIGPYLGGQRRDILLTLEEWRERRIGTA